MLWYPRGFKRAPQLGTYNAERRKSLGQLYDWTMFLLRALCGGDAQNKHFAIVTALVQRGPKSWLSTVLVYCSLHRDSILANRRSTKDAATFVSHIHTNIFHKPLKYIPIFLRNIFILLHCMLIKWCVYIMNEVFSRTYFLWITCRPVLCGWW